MNEPPLNVLGVVGTLGRGSATRTVVDDLGRRLRALGAEVDIFDPHEEPLPLFNPESADSTVEFRKLQVRVVRADAFILATPDYHGCISSPMKNFLDHFWQEFTGKLFASVVGSHEKGLTVIDQLRTVARQCYAWTLPYGVSFATPTDVKDGRIITEALDQRLAMLTHDLHVYGRVLRRQRQIDLAGTAPGFLARLRLPVAATPAAEG